VTRTRSVRLDWTGEGLAFRGTGASGVPVAIDSEAAEGTSPMETLLLALGGCMAVDVLMILKKSRVPVTALSVVAQGRRAESVPQPFESLSLVYELEGPRPQDQTKLDRAIQLSRDKYCGVLHTLRPDLELTIEVRRADP